ncbi:MAG TPA: polysaccharide deacetylase family protein [Opitutus sp.]|nr:polysaccharide deacetylase family protein [Opitutus sp.]
MNDDTLTLPPGRSEPAAGSGRRSGAGLPRWLAGGIVAAKAAGVACWLAPFALHGWAGAVMFFGPDVFLLAQIFVPSAAALCAVHTRFRARGVEVWLTIDDGPDPADTPRILDALDRHGARATFFLIGERAARHPELVREIARRGHEAGCHTQTHPVASFWAAGPRRTAREIDAARAAIRAGGAEPRRFRTPVGIKNFFLARVLAERGLRCIGWSVRSRDGIDSDAARVERRVARRLRPGAIVLMHEGPAVAAGVRVVAIERVLRLLAERGLRCVVPTEDQLEDLPSEGRIRGASRRRS